MEPCFPAFQLQNEQTGSPCVYAGCRAYNREREAAAQRRRAAEADAYARSRKILEEELARDRAWRDAVKQVWEVN